MRDKFEFVFNFLRESQRKVLSQTFVRSAMKICAFNFRAKRKEAFNFGAKRDYNFCVKPSRFEKYLSGDLHLRGALSGNRLSRDTFSRNAFLETRSREKKAKHTLYYDNFTPNSQDKFTANQKRT